MRKKTNDTSDKLVEQLRCSSSSNEIKEDDGVGEDSHNEHIDRENLVDLYIQNRKDMISQSLIAFTSHIAKIICVYDDSWKQDADLAVLGDFGRALSACRFGNQERRSLSIGEGWRLLKATHTLFCTNKLKLRTDGYVPQGFGLIKNLRELRLRYNNLVTLPGDIAQLSGSLKILDLAGNSITKIPPCVQHLSLLQELKVDHNKLKSLQGVEHMVNLKILTANYNKIKALPRGIANLIDLEVLYLSDNILVSLPNEIRKLRNLKYIHLNGNRLSRLPGGFKKLQNLKRITLDRQLHADESAQHLRTLGTFITNAHFAFR
mmetsp:Transcript_6112/g.10147  ORF Transcript_6112/g.10147 Transcript_6112/m.10147 type:complete len:319 (+) Transcript_6112:100-1056(+)